MMIEKQIIDFSKCPKNNRHGRYAGNAGDKDGITYNNENWIIKYPKSTRSMQGTDLPSYTTSPISEYIGSHIYEMLDIPVHETLLGIRNEKLVVGCKDFCKHYGDLLEIRSIKNSANEELSKIDEDKLPVSATGDNVSLEELLLHFKVNPMIQREDVQKRFWTSIIVDILIDNNDRNNGNWGLLYDDDIKGYTLAPVFDNGNSFLNKASDEKITSLLQEMDENKIIGTRTIYTYHDHLLSAKKLIQFDNIYLKEAIKKYTPKIKNKLDDIYKFIDEIPTEISYKDKIISVCSLDRKEYYKLCIAKRFDKILQPEYDKIIQQEKKQNIEHEER